MYCVALVQYAFIGGLKISLCVSFSSVLGAPPSKPRAPSLLASGLDAIQLGWIPLDGVQFKLFASVGSREFGAVEYTTTDMGHYVREIGGEPIIPSARYCFALACENKFGQSELSEELYVDTPELEEMEALEGTEESRDHEREEGGGEAAVQSPIEGQEQLEESGGYSTALVLDESETDFVDLPANWREYWDANSELCYYYDTISGETTCRLNRGCPLHFGNADVC